MKLFLNFSIFFLIASSAFGDCGLNGTVTERVADCKKTIDGMNLVMKYGSNSYWLDPAQNIIFFVSYGKTWADANSGCLLQNDKLAFDQSKNRWQMADKNMLYTNLISVFPELARPSSDFYEKRFRFGKTYMHPSGELWSQFYSTLGRISSWFADASDDWYKGGICALPLF